MTFMFLLVILGATDRRAPQGFAPIAIGLMLALIHLITIPVTNTSVNPARSTGPALIVGVLGGKMELFGQVFTFSEPQNHLIPPCHRKNWVAKLDLFWWELLTIIKIRF